MTQTQPDRIDQLESFIERMDRKLDAISSDVQEMKLNLGVFQAKTDERLNSIDQRLDRIEKRIDAQDARIWTLIVSALIAVMGLLAKLSFFPDLKT